MTRAVEFDKCNQNSKLAAHLQNEQSACLNYVNSVILTVIVQYKGANEKKLYKLAEKKFFISNEYLIQLYATQCSDWVMNQRSINALLVSCIYMN